MLLDESEDLLMIVIEELDGNYRIITENGIVDYLDKEKLENCYFVKVGTTTLIKNVMSIFTQIRRNEIENK